MLHCLLWIVAMYFSRIHYFCNFCNFCCELLPCIFHAFLIFFSLYQFRFNWISKTKFILHNRVTLLTRSLNWLYICMCITWVARSYYLPSIFIIGIAFTLNIHTSIHTILKMCFQLVSSITAFASLKPIQGILTRQHNFSVAEKDQEESCILGVEYENLEKKIIIK